MIYLIDVIVEIYQEWRIKRALKHTPIKMLMSMLGTEKPEVVSRIFEQGQHYMREMVMERVKEAITLLYRDVDIKYTGENYINEYDPAEKIYLRIKIDMTKEMVLSYLENKILDDLKTGFEDKNRKK